MVLFMRPQVAVFENVPEIASWNGGAIFQLLTETLRSASYRVTCRVLRLWPWLPQDRRRWFLMACRADAFGQTEWDE